MGRWFSYFLNRKECITIASTELKTSVTYEATGEQTVFNIPFDYLRNSFVKAKIGDDGEPMKYGTDYEVANRQITFTTAPVGMLYVYRKTPTDRMVQFMEGSVLKATDMNISTLQQLHIIEEAQDWTTSNSIIYSDEILAWEGFGHRLTNIADPLDAQDVVTKNYMESVQDGFVQRNTALKDEATRQANIAIQQATIATQQATISTTKATESTNQANRAQAWAESAESPDGEADSKSSKTWAEQAANSAGAALTSQNAAASSQSAAKTSETNAANSAATATQQAATATTKATEASNSANAASSSQSAAASSASAALASQNAAKTSETNAANSASEAAKSAKDAADTAAGLGNPVMSVEADNGVVTVTKADNTQTTYTLPTYTHPTSGVTAGTYRSVTVDANGHVTAGSNTTTTIAQGGTGATTASTALQNLGIINSNNHLVLPDGSEFWIK